ncbi:MAG: sigma-70 family RNA polymerase sigma factor [Gammaproteobacteria bacterium]
MTDEELMAAVCSGDETAYQAIVRQHIKPISHYAYRMLGNRKDCEDITQETFLRLWLNAKKWQPEKARLSTWLHRIAHNLCVDMLRKTSRFEDMAEPQDIVQQEYGENSAEQDEKIKKLNRAIARLPESQRSALMLCHYQNFSNKEAAEIMNTSVKAVESALTRARHSLRNELQEYLR